MEEESLEIYKINSEQNYVFLDSEKTCIGKKKFTYILNKEITQDLLKIILEQKNEGKLIFPFGEKYKFFSIDIPFKFLLTGILGDKEIKMTMKLSANLQVKSELEKVLISYCKT